MSVYGKYLTYAVLALGVNLLWVYTGILSLGQCLFFSLGGYDDINAPDTKRALFMCSVTLLLLVYLFCRWLTSTKFGLIQRAVRDSENRVLFSGYATANF